MEKVFISYSHTDTSVADMIATVLEDLEIPYFRDVKDIEWGDTITDTVRDGLDTSVAIIVIISPGNLKSHWVSYETGYATALGKKVLPYLTHPSIDTPGFLSGLLHIKSEEKIREYFKSMIELNTSKEVEYSRNVNSSISDTFDKLSVKMPILFAEMKEGLSSSGNEFTREFVVLPEGATFNHNKKRFEYRSNVHEDLLNQVDILVDKGFVSIVRNGQTKIYRMTEEFVTLLLSSITQ